VVLISSDFFVICNLKIIFILFFNFLRPFLTMGSFAVLFNALNNRENALSAN